VFAFTNSVSGINWGGLGVGRPPPPKKVKKDFCHGGESVLDLVFIRMIFKINVGVQSTADNSVPAYLLGLGDGSEVDRNSRRSGRPPHKALLQ